MEVKWLDGKSAESKYVLEIVFLNGSKGYIKNDSLEQIIRYQNLMNTDEQVSQTIIHDPVLAKCA